MDKQKQQFPYGAVYFRKSNPPKQDWERDYRQAAEDGFGLFRHWLIWGAIEKTPGVYDWSDYDRQLELAEKNGIQVILAEITMSVPAWVSARYSHLFPQDIQRSRCVPEMAGNSGVGGFPTGLCLDKPEAKKLTGDFLRAAALHFKGHPALLGYDIANECYRRPESCYCEDTAREYRLWLKKKYGSIEAVNEKWHIYSFVDFEDIVPPYRLGFFADTIDWLQFRYEKTYETIQWKIDQIRDVDPDALITAHGMNGSFSNYSLQCTDHWAAAKTVDVYGVTWVPCRKGNEPWCHMFIFDLIRSACKGKPFWHTEAQGGPLWMQPQLLGRSRQDGRVPDKDDIRLWNLMLMASGGKGIVYTRWRPLLDGPLFDGFAPYSLDGSRTERSVQASQMAQWANAPEQKELWEARPAVGDIHLLFVPECANASFLLARSAGEAMYAPSMEGAYRGFFSQNIQVDFVHIDELKEEKVVYFPFPSAISREHANILMDWVKQGGILISEACPGFFTEYMHTCSSQPGQGLDKLFGVKQAEAEFMPDLAGEIYFELFEETVQGGGFTQFYQLDGAKAVAYYQGKVIAAEHRYGAGKTLLIGSGISLAANKEGTIYKRLLEHFSIKPKLQVSDSELIIRLHKTENKQILWILNPSRRIIKSKICLADRGKLDLVYWKGGEVDRCGDGELEVSVEARNGIVIALRF